MATDSVVKGKNGDNGGKKGKSKPPSRAKKRFLDAHEPLAESHVSLFGPLTRQVKILVIEDGVNIRNKMERILSEQGYSVIATATSKEGIKKFRETNSSVSLVILNTTVDEDKGLKTIDTLRGINPDLLMLLKTTKRSTRRGDLGEHMARGVRAVLRGSITERKLIRKVNRIFELNREMIETALKNSDDGQARKIMDMRINLAGYAPNPVQIINGNGTVKLKEEQMPLLEGLEYPVTGRNKSIIKKKIRISHAYDAIASGYESHMKVTNHFQTMAAVDGNYYPVFGSTIVDLACGDGQLMRRWAREHLIEMVKIHPNYVVRYLGVDISEGMIDVAQRKFENLKKEFKDNYKIDLVGNNLLAQFIVSDIANLGKTIKLEDTVIGVPNVETVLISYGMHWFPDKDEVAGVVSRILEKDGGIFRSIEEKSEPQVDGKGGLTLHITPSIHLPQELAESVEKEATPVSLYEMRQIFAKKGLLWIPRYELEHHIGEKSKNHIVYGNLFMNISEGHSLDDVERSLRDKLERRTQTTISTIPPEKRERSRFTKPPAETEEKK